MLFRSDPFFYGSFIQLFARLAMRYPTQVVPGVSSLAACAAAAGVPLAVRDDVLTVIPAPLPEDQLQARLAGAEAAAVIKLGRHFEKVRRVLTRLGRAAGTIYVERASLESQRVLPLATVDASAVPYFSMLLVRRPDPAAP